MDGVSLSSDTGKESRMIHLPVAVFDFSISVLHLAAPCFFLGLIDFLYIARFCSLTETEYMEAY